MMRNCRTVLLFSFILVVRSGLSQCVDLGNSQEKQILRYVRAKYKIPQTVSLSTGADKLLGDSCFRKLTIEGKSNVTEWSFEVFVSPDRKFISTDLMEISSDPVLDEIKRDQETMKQLSDGNVPWRGVKSAPVTIVEFSDFQCPYCRSFSQLLSSEMAANPGSVKLIFRHLPLSMHPWAKTAAEGAACGGLQSQGAFWQIHDQLFALQDELTVGNIRSELVMAAQQYKLDLKAFTSCIDDQMSMGIVLRDIKAASLYQVTGTPTLFINGRRMDAMQDQAALHRAIEQAAKESALKVSSHVTEHSDPYVNASASSKLAGH